jgi:hypothetical protein
VGLEVVGVLGRVVLDALVHVPPFTSFARALLAEDGRAEAHAVVSAAALVHLADHVEHGCGAAR